MKENKKYILPFVALRGITVVPGMAIHFDVSRKKSIRAIEEAMNDVSGNQQIFVVTQKNPEAALPKLKDMYEVGTIATIKQVIKMPNAILRVVVEGQFRAKFGGSFMTKDDAKDVVYAEAIVLNDDTTKISDIVKEAMLRKLKDLIKLYAQINTSMSRDSLHQLLDASSLEMLIHRIMVDFPMDYTKRQKLLEITSVEVRFEEIARILANETQILQIKDDLSHKVSQLVEKNQKEYVLREQLKAIHEELGESDPASDSDEYSNLVEKLQASEEVKSKLNKEIKRYKTLSGSSSEANVCRGYIETLLDLPWDKTSTDNNDINHAKEILDEDHYGLKKVKERILEYLAVRTFSNSGDSTIICLVGPPGTGKTSIARSVARALDKEYVRICLGGVRDESEIRGHRKTYVGAMPGRIIEGLRQAKVKNPVMLLDEIDKVSKDYRSDTSSALLEVLDPEQNKHFRDHYVELPTDLSEVLFIATANDLSDMPRPLLDRMEIIEVNSYTANEKLAIAKEYLIPKQLKKVGLTKNEIKFSDKAIQKIIEGYTREAGVRNLERTIAHICRKAVTNYLMQGGNGNNNKFARVKITDRNLADYLEKEKYHKESLSRKLEVGIVRGLAWTAVGGDTLQIEVNVLPGKGTLLLTGQMGDVMQESAKIALSYVKSVAGKYNVPKEYFENVDFHIHIPEGAVKKDGPSAGITMSTALLSAVTDKKVKADIAMTGEVTLRGKVLPVGGLKEKLLAANVTGIKMVLVPEKNRPDIEELDEEIIGNMQVEYVSDMEQVAKLAFVNVKK